ncbi:condensation domain-containing protein [Nocardioides zeae]|uniref:Acyl carrier protein n=1 Tax=Nocardioides zeae TaxID=1457234 RepID=A0AAJ1TVI9_9ACTN|nr:condensation domain-containing protein [Nocardioides zeae]MDQ1102845.1 acyl carrier protein [Nocardioides zeae]
MPAGTADEIALHVAELVTAELAGVHCGLDDTFFSVGIDSLKAARVLARVRQTYAVRISMGDMFRHDTPRKLATRVLEAEAGEVSPPQQPRRPLRYGPLSLSQLPFWEMDRATGGAGLFNTVMDFQFDGEVDVEALHGAVHDVVERQPVLRTTYYETPAGPVQRVCDEPHPVRQFDLRGAASTSSFNRFLLREHRTGFDVASAPPVRITILRLGSRVWSVVVTLHHLATDGWSTLVLAQDLAESYRRRVTGQEPLPSAGEYLDFAHWQRNTLVGERLEEHLDHLTRVFATRSPRIGSAPPARPSYRTGIDRVRLSSEVMDRYSDLALRTGTTRFVTLAAAVLSFAQELTGSSRQLLSIQSANRSWPGSQDLIGCFSNVVHVATTGEHGDLQDLLQEVGVSLAAAVSHDELPFDHALRQLEGRGKSIMGNLPGLAFSIQPVPAGSVALPGCSMRPRPVEQPIDGIDPTTYPLVVELTESGSGVVRRARDHWTDENYDHARTRLLKVLESFPTSTIGVA